MTFGFSIKNTTRRRIPKAKFELIKDYILGKRYELSLVFCGDALSRSLNRHYRDKDKATNVLSFKLSKDSGEIFINLYKMKKFSPTYLFVHGCLHLKGMEHGDTMNKAEKKYLNVASNHRWD
ncbi:MAG: rRNA maturation RNase YbeY [Candidatus Zambryskibacteria bacterium]|nr:rRNA maturation RNase YbeY [Candidatus Zambryskibacteria bacterium]